MLVVASQRLMRATELDVVENLEVLVLGCFLWHGTEGRGIDMLGDASAENIGEYGENSCLIRS